jgi:hypothetical protein
MVFQHAREREDVADIIVDHQDLLSGHDRIGVMQMLEHLPLLLGQLGLDAMEEERGLVEQTLGRLHILQDDRLRVFLDPCLVLRTQVSASVDDDRQVLLLVVGFHLF